MSLLRPIFLYKKNDKAARETIHDTLIKNGSKFLDMEIEKPFSIMNESY